MVSFLGNTGYTRITPCNSARLSILQERREKEAAFRYREAGDCSKTEACVASLIRQSKDGFKKVVRDMPQQETSGTSPPTTKGGTGHLSGSLHEDRQPRRRRATARAGAVRRACSAPCRPRSIPSRSARRGSRARLDSSPSTRDTRL
jgi:hypothetical protein